MNTLIAAHYKDKIVAADLPFTDRIAGLVRTANVKQGNDDFSALKTFPVACEATAEDCGISGTRIRELVPDAKKKSVIFFEDNGCAFSGMEGAFLNFVSSLTLVCWLNPRLLGKSDCSISATVIANIISAFETNKFFSAGGQIAKARVTSISEAPKTVQVFSRYTFDEGSAQYGLFPYDYFGLTIETSFSVNPSCIDTLIIDEPVC